MAKLECAECRARVADDHERCPKCGGRLLAPPGILDRRSTLVVIYGAGVGLMVLAGLVWFGVLALRMHLLG